MMLGRLAFLVAFASALWLVAAPALTGRPGTPGEPDLSALVACALAVAGWLGARRRTER